MKKIVIFAISLFVLKSINAQNIEVYKNGFAGLSPGWSANYFSQSDVNGSKFLYQEWHNGSVTNLANQTFSTGYLFLFDKSTQSIYVKTTNVDSNTILIIDKAQIRTFTLNADKQHVFIPGKNYGATYKNNFFEVLAGNDSAYIFLKLITTKFVRADTHNMLNAINGNNKSSYVDETSYYVSYKNGPLQKVELKEKSFKNALINKDLAVQNYFAQAGKKDRNEKFYIDLIQSVNN